MKMSVVESYEMYETTINKHITKYLIDCMCSPIQGMSQCKLSYHFTDRGQTLEKQIWLILETVGCVCYTFAQIYRQLCTWTVKSYMY